MQTLFFGLAHATPSQGNADPEVRGARGAWFEALALADDEDAFRERVRIELEQMDFELAEIEEPRPFVSMLEEAILAPSLLEDANRAAHENETTFGPFHLYDEENDEDERSEDAPTPEAVLATALERGAPIRLRRASAAQEQLDGFVVATGASWCLLNVVEANIELNGYAAFPLSDVVDAWLDDERADFVNTAMRLRAFTPKSPEHVELDDARRLLGWADAAYPLITVYVERDVPGVCYVGRVGTFGDEEFELALITPTAHWEDEQAFRYDAVTRLDFGGRYEDALARVAASRT